MSQEVLPTIELDRPAVFIGLGPLTEDQRASVLTLASQLEEKCFKVFLYFHEPGKRVGTDYRKDLHSWIDACEACILLFTETGIKDSEWLPVEASILEHRRYSEPEFILIPLFAGTTKPDDLNEGRWSPLRLADLQGLAYESPDLLDTLLERLKVLHDRRKVIIEPLGGLIIFLKASFGMIDPDLARVILQALGEQTGWLHKGELPLRLTLSLLQTRDVVSLGNSVRALVSFKMDVARYVLQICLPFAWLDDSVADGMKKAYSAARPAWRAAATWSPSDITCEMVVRRACAKHPPWPICVISDYDRDSPSEGLLNAARREMASYYFAPGEDVPDDELRLEISNDPCVLLIPPPLPDADVLEPLRNAFPRVILLFTATTWDDVRGMGYDDLVVYLESLPPPEVEKKVLDTRRRVLRDLARMQPLGYGLSDAG